VKVPKPSFLGALANRVLSRVVAANGGYIFNLRGRWRYESRFQRRAQRVDQGVSPRREWSGEVLAYAWLSRQARDRAPAADTSRKPDSQILALTRS
jgi:hypothetical protein